MSIAHKDDKLVQLRAQFGMWGIGVYWTLVELVADQIRENSEKAVATFVVQELLGLLKCRRQQLVSYLLATEQLSLIKHTMDRNNPNLLLIQIDKILDFADNYIKYDGKSLKCLQRQKGDVLKVDKIRIEEIRRDKITTSYDNDISLNTSSEKIDLEQHLLAQWGREGRQGQDVMKKFVDLITKHGRQKVLDAITTAAKYNAKSLAYVLGILEPKDAKSEREKVVAEAQVLWDKEHKNVTN
jgi:hypothetical protein